MNTETVRPDNGKDKSVFLPQHFELQSSFKRINFFNQNSTSIMKDQILSNLDNLVQVESTKTLIITFKTKLS